MNARPVNCMHSNAMSFHNVSNSEKHLSMHIFMQCVRMCEHKNYRLVCLKTCLDLPSEVTGERRKGGGGDLEKLSMSTFLSRMASFLSKDRDILIESEFLLACKRFLELP